MTTKRYKGPPGDERVYILPRDLDEWEAAWTDYLRDNGPVTASDDATDGGTEVRDNAWDDIPF